MIKAIIFDYDGVIVDSFYNVFEVYQIICKELGKTMPATTLDEFRKVYGRSFLECYHTLGIIRPDEREKAERIFKREILKKAPNLFEGITDALKKLSERYKLILVSATYKEEVIQKLSKFDIIKHFTTLIGQKHETDTPLSKAREIARILNEEGLTPEEVISIGDRDIDYEQGKKAGLKHIILVEYGWGYHQETLPHQKVLVYKPIDLLKAIEAIDTNP